MNSYSKDLAPTPPRGSPRIRPTIPPPILSPFSSPPQAQNVYTTTKNQPRPAVHEIVSTWRHDLRKIEEKQKTGDGGRPDGGDIEALSFILKSAIVIANDTTPTVLRRRHTC